MFVCVLIFVWQLVLPREIIVRQRGTKFHPGLNIIMGSDHTLHAKVKGIVKFSSVKSLKMVRGKRERRFVDVIPVVDSAFAVSVGAIAEGKTKPSAFSVIVDN